MQLKIKTIVECIDPFLSNQRNLQNVNTVFTFTNWYLPLLLISVLILLFSWFLSHIYQFIKNLPDNSLIINQFPIKFQLLQNCRLHNLAGNVLFKTIKQCLIFFFFVHEIIHFINVNESMVKSETFDLWKCYHKTIKCFT